MNLLKAPMFLLIFSLANQQVFAGDYESCDGCSITLDSGQSNEVPSSINYLENMPNASWLRPAMTSAATLFFLTLEYLPGPLICNYVANGLVCNIVGWSTGLIGDFGALASAFGTGILTYKSWEDAKKKKQYLEMAQLIRDAYDFQSSENTLHRYLANYQDRTKSTQSAKQLAEKIILANEAGFFVPPGAFMNQEIADFQGLILGHLFQKEPQQAVDELMAMKKEDLEKYQSAFRAAKEKWRADIEEAQKAATPK